MHLGYYLKFIFKLKKKKLITQQLKSIFELKTKAKLIIFDVDDTLVKHGQKIPSATIEFLKHLQKKSKVALISNCTKKRSRELSKLFFKEKIYLSKVKKKPSPEGYIKILNKFKVNPKDAAMVGDRIGTDLYGAYLAKIKERILVNPCGEGKKTPLYLAIPRKLEKLISGVHNQ